MLEIQSSLESHPAKYTAWFRIAFPVVLEWVNKNEAITTH
jgi:hypothetical protein